MRALVWAFGIAAGASAVAGVSNSTFFSLLILSAVFFVGAELRDEIRMSNQSDARGAKL